MRHLRFNDPIALCVLLYPKECRAPLDSKQLFEKKHRPPNCELQEAVVMYFAISSILLMLANIGATFYVVRIATFIIMVTTKQPTST